MSGIHQRQRQAIEVVSAHLKPITLYPDQRFFLDGEEIFLLGISECVGSCGNMKYVNFAVFDKSSNGFVFDRPHTVSGCVYLRNASEEEERGEGSDGDALRLVIEAMGQSTTLWLDAGCYFERIGFKKVYKPTIC